VSKEEKDLPETLPRWEIPASWQWVSVSDVGTVSTGNTPPTKETDNYGNFIPFVKPPELRDRGVREATDGLSEKGIKFSRTLPAGAVLVSCIGGLGKTGLAKIPVAFNQQINAIIFDVSVLPEFGFYYMQTLKPWLYEVSSATTLPIVNKGKFLRAPFPLAPLKDQQKIVAEIEKQFSRLDEAVASLKRIQANLKRYKAAVLKAAVEGKLTEQWRKDHPDVEPADQLLKRILAERRAKWEAEELAKMKVKDVRAGLKPAPTLSDSWKKKYKEPAGPDTANLPELPEGWVWGSVEQLANIMLGKMLDKAKHLSGNRLPYLRNVNVRWGRVETDDLFEMFFENSQLDRYGLVAGDVLVCEGGEPGRAAVWSGKFPDMKYQKALHRVRCCQGYEPRILVVLLEHLAKSGRLENWFTGSTIKHFTRESFVQIPVPLPSMSEQKAILEEIDRRLSVTEELETTIETSLKRAERLRQTILQQAFSGGLV